MYRQFGGPIGELDGTGSTPEPIANSDALSALKRIGTRRSFRRDNEIYAEGDVSDSWYRVVSGAVRVCKVLPDGRRHIAEFFFGGDCFGLDNGAERAYSAEAIGDVVLMRYPMRTTGRLINENPHLAQRLCEMTLCDLAHAQSRMLLLGRMTARERVANFLLEMAERRDAQRKVDLPMSRTDIADYLGLTMETVCRTFTSFKRAGAIAIRGGHCIEFREREALAAACEA